MPSSQLSKPVEILLVEDSPTDVLMTKEAFSEGSVPVSLHCVEDGVEAIDFLRKRGKYNAAPRPDLILLDLNLPRKNGREVLAEIKSDKDLKDISVIVLTTSQAEEDVASAYDLHANCYIIKPVDYISFAETIRAIQTFWLSVVTPASRN